MKNALAIALIIAVAASSGLAAGKGPDIRIIDNKVSVQAESVPLARLLRLLDQATGMTSKVPPELANRNVSVRFSNLTFDAAIRKIFEGLPFDYVVIPGQSIRVTGSSQTALADNSPAPYSPPPQENTFVEDNPPFPPNMNPNMNPNNQPAMIQTPFGPIRNPNIPQGQQQNGAVPFVQPGQAIPVPAPNNPFNNNLPGFNGGSALPTMQSNPPFGTPPGQINPGQINPYPSGFPPATLPGMQPGTVRPIP